MDHFLGLSTDPTLTAHDRQLLPPLPELPEEMADEHLMVDARTAGGWAGRARRAGEGAGRAVGLPAET